ncbi:MAG: hypothetical protein EOP09_07005, partial [Proteobacteria bacterium]
MADPICHYVMDPRRVEFSKIIQARDAGAAQAFHKSENVMREQIRRARVNQVTSDKPFQKIDHYLAVLDSTHSRAQSNPRFLERLKKYYLSKNVIGESQIPQAHYDLQLRIARERGHGHLTLTADHKKMLAQVVIDEQFESLSRWFDYLWSPDALGFPEYLKLWILDGVTKISKFDPIKEKFTK